MSKNQHDSPIGVSISNSSGEKDKASFQVKCAVGQSADNKLVGGFIVNGPVSVDGYICDSPRSAYVICAEGNYMLFRKNKLRIVYDAIGAALEEMNDE